MSKNHQEEKKKISWRRIRQNSAYMLRLIAKACPSMLVMQFLSTVFGAAGSFLANTYLYMYALNALSEGRELKSILLTLAAMLAYAVASTGFGVIADCHFEIKSSKIQAYIQNLIQKKAVEVDAACFEDPEFYDTYIKAMEQATWRAYSVMFSVVNIIWIVINLASVGTLLAVIDPLFLLLACLPLLCTLLVGRRRNRIRYEYNMRSAEARRQRDYVRRAFYLKDFAKEMRLTQMWRVMFRRMHESVAEMKEIVNRYGYRIMFFRYLFDLVFGVAVNAGTIILAAFKTLVRKSMPLGDCFVAINSIVGLAHNINYAGNVIFELDENAMYAENLRGFLEYKTKIAEDENAPAVPAFRELTLKNVSFRYAGQTQPALSGVNLTVRAGERIAVVGHNGAGKTTLVKILQRLYDPCEGEVLINGENIKNYRLSTYRELFGTVFQDCRLFAATVAENVLLRGDITDDDRKTVAEALRSAGMYDRVEALPHGMDSNVTKEFDEQGAVFSGGEAQKLAIARIFAGKQEIVIMDEPTSALDPIAEQEMYRNMFEACRGRSVIFISHRLSGAAMADRIYVFEHGRVIEHGTHRELLAKNAVYADMWHKQADTYTLDAEDAREVTV